MAVNSIDAARIRLANRTQIVRYQGIFKARAASDWLPALHPATRGQVLRPDGTPIKKLSDARATFTNEQLVSLIAASGPNHCIDGWGFLARSTSSLVARDSHAARHFAYYAQLRGALSVLSASGIGVFNGLNVFADGAGNISKLENGNEKKSGTGTHGIVWPALDAWARIDANAEVFLSAITIHGVSILECIRAIWPSRQASSIVVPLLNSWSLDLTLGTSHHVQRNISSYAPHQLNNIDGTFRSDMDFLASIWELLEPSASLGFDQLDAYFLRQILQSLYESDNSQLPDTEQVSIIESPIAARYDELDSAVKQSVPLAFLISDRGIEEPSLFSLAHENGSKPTSMISRAVLLMRAATGFTRHNFVSAGLSIDGSDIRPWLNPVATGRGFSLSSSPPEMMANLWDEVKFAIEDFRDAVSAEDVEAMSFYANNDNGLPIVTQFERAGLWSLCR